MGTTRTTKKPRPRKAGPGHVYVLTNPCMPGLVKIGRTSRDVMARVAELNAASGVPLPFTVECAVRSWHPSAAEARVHEALAGSRVSRKREFFRCTPAEAEKAARAAARATGGRFVGGRSFTRRVPGLLAGLALGAAGAAGIAHFLHPVVAAAWGVTAIWAGITGRPRPMSEIAGWIAEMGKPVAFLVLAAGIAALLADPTITGLVSGY